MERGHEAGERISSLSSGRIINIPSPVLSPSFRSPLSTRTPFPSCLSMPHSLYFSFFLYFQVQIHSHCSFFFSAISNFRSMCSSDLRSHRVFGSKLVAPNFFPSILILTSILSLVTIPLWSTFIPALLFHSHQQPSLLVFFISLSPSDHSIMIHPLLKTFSTFFYTSRRFSSP